MGNGRLALPIGWHHLEVKDVHGHRVYDRWVEVEAFEAEKVAYGRDGRRPVMVAAGHVAGGSNVGAGCTMK